MQIPKDLIKEAESSLKKNQHDIQKIHVTHEKMKNYMLEKKIDEYKIMKIYNLVDLEKFKFSTQELSNEHLYQPKNN